MKLTLMRATLRRGVVDMIDETVGFGRMAEDSGTFSCIYNDVTLFQLSAKTKHCLYRGQICQTHVSNESCLRIFIT